MLLKKKTRVIIDTNILFLPGQLGIDIFSELEKSIYEPFRLCTFDKVLDELQKLMAKKSKDGFNAKLGFILAKQKDLKTLPSSNISHADDVFVLKTNLKDIVVTQDIKLISRLRSKGVRVLRFESKKFVFQK